jgi:hypothetical protein
MRMTKRRCDGDRPKALDPLQIDLRQCDLTVVLQLSCHRRECVGILDIRSGTDQHHRRQGVIVQQIYRLAEARQATKLVEGLRAVDQARLVDIGAQVDLSLHRACLLVRDLV